MWYYIYIHTCQYIYIYCIYVCNYTMYKNHTNFTNGFQMPHPLKAQVSGIVFSGSKTPGAPKKPKKMIASALKSRTHPAEVSEFFYGNFGKRLEAMGLVRPWQDYNYRDNRQIVLKMSHEKSPFCFEVPKNLQNIQRCSWNMCEMCQLTSFLHPISYTDGDFRSH